MLPGLKGLKSNQIEIPNTLDNAAVEGHLRELLFLGMRKGIRDSL